MITWPLQSYHGNIVTNAYDFKAAVEIQHPYTASTLNGLSQIHE